VKNIEKIIKEYELSDKYSQVEICRKYGITLNVFQYYKRKMIENDNWPCYETENSSNNQSSAESGRAPAENNHKQPKTIQPRIAASSGRREPTKTARIILKKPKRKNPDHEFWQCVIPQHEADVKVDNIGVNNIGVDTVGVDSVRVEEKNWSGMKIPMKKGRNGKEFVDISQFIVK